MKHSHAVESLACRIRKEYNSKIPDVQQILVDSGLEGRCNKIDDEVASLREEEQRSAAALDEKVAQLKDLLQQKLQFLDSVEDRLAEDSKEIERLAQVGEVQDARLSAEEQQVAENVARMNEIKEALPDFAKAKEVQSMMRDILLIWNSIKQLDTAKTDKKDMDSFALETSNREKFALRRVEDLEADVASKVDESTLRAQEKWSDLDSRLEESAKQVRHWEQMWEKMASFVEDLVGKINDLQGKDVGRPPSASLRNRQPPTPVSAPARPPSAGRPQTPKNQAASQPHLLETGSTEVGPTGTTRVLPQGAETVEPKTLWINSAKDIVHQTMDQALGLQAHTHSAKPRLGRPKSASTRRPHDRR